MDAMTLHVQVSGIIARRIAGETILVPSQLRAQEMALFTLNEVGTYVWEQIDGTTDCGALVRQVVEAFDVELQRAESDVGEFLADLMKAGCVTEVAA